MKAGSAAASRSRRPSSPVSVRKRRAPRSGKEKKGGGAVLAIDVGNSHTSIGVFDGPRLTAQFRLSSGVTRTGDELIPMLSHLLGEHRDVLSRSKRAVIASVVPSLTEAYLDVVWKILEIRPLLVSNGILRGIKLDVPDPDSVGADRMANAVAAAELHGVPSVTVDLGTTTNFDVVLPGPRYVGGAIAPGLVSSAEELFRRGARLPKVEIRRPERVLGRTTTECLQSGVYFGAVGQIDGLVRRLLAEIPGSPIVIATGGLAETIAKDSETIQRVDPALTLHGLRIIE
jgi:type III pantothenate kinase